VQQWVKRVQLFEQMLSRSDGAAGARRGLEQTLAEVRKLVRELSEVREASTAEQRQLEEIDARGRDGRQRFGAAVDALGLDASKARGELRASRESLERFAHESKARASGYKEVQRDVVTWEGRTGMEEPYLQLAEAYRACADAVASWHAARALEKAAQSAAEGKERMVTDLDYQIAELRAALAHHEQGIDRDREAAQKRLVDLNARAERVEAQLLQLATRFCEPLRSQPELGTLFQQLESEAVAR
jgi:serine/threonine-protein kinase